MNEIEELLDQITKELESDDPSNVYKFPNSHFEIGKNLHSNTYYFIRKYLQESDKCAKLSLLLEDLLNKRFGSDTPLTLIGYGNHVGMLLSMVTEKNKHIKRDHRKTRCFFCF